MKGLVIPWLEHASRRKRWLVGVSGGLDSMALLHILHEEGFSDLVVCHLDHGLRGAASTGDAKFVQKVAVGMGFKVEITKADVRGAMIVRRESLETAARAERHAFFGECARKYRCNRLLLAHHADDQAETVLWNLMRGSHGFRGMSGTKRIRMGGRTMEVERPLLGLRKQELEDWMSLLGFRFREDASNATNDVVRNRIRNEALPLLREISGRDVSEMLVRNASATEQMRELVSWAVEKANAVDPQGRLHLKVISALPLSLQREVILEFLKKAGVSGIDSDLLERCASLTDTGMPASVNLPGGVRFRRRQGRLFVEEP